MIQNTNNSERSLFCLRQDGLKWKVHMIELNKENQWQCWWCKTVFNSVEKQKGDSVNGGQNI